MAPAGLIETSIIPSAMQAEVMGFLVRDAEIIGRFGSLVKEEYFENYAHRVIFRAAREYFSQFSRLIPKRILEQEVNTFVQAHRAEIIIPVNTFWREIERIYNQNVVERAYMVSKVTNYLLRSSLSELGEVAMTQAGSEVCDMAPVSGAINKLFTMLSSGNTQKVERLFADVDTRERINPVLAKVPTGFQVVDRTLGGGLGVGELGVIMAPPAFGKSFWLNAFGLYAVKTMRKVAHVSLELSARSIIARYESSVTRIPKALLHADARVLGLLQRAKRLLSDADVRVEGFPTRSLSVDELRAVLTRIIAVEEFVPDLLIVDYADIMKPVTKSRDEKRYESLGVIYETLRGLAQEFRIPVWTGSQANKASMSKEIITMADMSESFAKAAVSDVILGICRTPTELAAHKGRLYFAKNRDNAGFKLVPFSDNFDIGEIKELSQTALDAVVVNNETEERAGDDHAESV